MQSFVMKRFQHVMGVEEGKSSAIYLEQREGGGGPEKEVGKCVIKEGRTAGWKSS
jgi:hypothetical protein